MQKKKEIPMAMIPNHTFDVIVLLDLRRSG